MINLIFGAAAADDRRWVRAANIILCLANCWPLRQTRARTLTHSHTLRRARRIKFANPPAERSLAGSSPLLSRNSRTIKQCIFIKMLIRLAQHTQRSALMDFHPALIPAAFEYDEIVLWMLHINSTLQVNSFLTRNTLLVALFNVHCT